MNLHRNIFGSDMNLPQNISCLGTNLVGCESGQVRICPEIYLIQKFFEFVFFFFFFFETDETDQLKNKKGSKAAAVNNDSCNKYLVQN